MYKNFISTQIKDWVKDEYCMRTGRNLVRINSIPNTNNYDELYEGAYIVSKNTCSD